MPWPTWRMSLFLLPAHHRPGTVRFKGYEGAGKGAGMPGSSHLGIDRRAQGEDDTLHLDIAMLRGHTARICPCSRKRPYALSPSTSIRRSPAHLPQPAVAGAAQARKLGITIWILRCWSRSGSSASTGNDRGVAGPWRPHRQRRLRLSQLAGLEQHQQQQVAVGGSWESASWIDGERMATAATITRNGFINDIGVQVSSPALSILTLLLLLRH